MFRLEFRSSLTAKILSLAGKPVFGLTKFKNSEIFIDRLELHHTQKRKMLVPGMLDTSVAIEVLDKFHAGPGEFATRGGSAPERYFDALAELGQSYRLAAKAR